MGTLLITGPIDSMDDYGSAAKRAGWQAICLALQLIKPRELTFDRERLARCELTLVTSSNALDALVRAAVVEPKLRSRPLWVVGERTRFRAQERAFETKFSAEGADDLAQRLLELPERPRHVFWPRGSISDELANVLRAGQIDVYDPVAYDVVPSNPIDLPLCDAVFFASPSVVRAWSKHRLARQPRTAIAIGPTTLHVLRSATATRFEAILSLRDPSPAALEHVLAHLEPHP